MIRRIIAAALAVLAPAVQPAVAGVIQPPSAGLNAPNVFSQPQTVAPIIGTTQQQSLQITGSYVGSGLFNRAIQDNSTMDCSGTACAYSSYDTTATLTCASGLACNHMYGFESRKTFVGPGTLNTYGGFITGDAISAPILAYRGYACQDLTLNPGGSVSQDDTCLYIPNLAAGASNYGVYSGQTTGYFLYQPNAGAQSLLAGSLTLQGGQTWANNGVINVTSSQGQRLNFATNTNLVVSGGGTITSLSSLNDASSAYEPLQVNASTWILNATAERIRVTGATGLIQLESQIATGPSSGSLTVSSGEIGLSKMTASGAAPGAAGGKLALVCGSTAGTAKIIIYAGTSTTPATLLDNIGSGVSGC